MDTIWTLLINNIEWLFSGIGTLIIAGLGRYFYRRKKKTSSQTIQSGKDSLNIQAGRDINIQAKSKEGIVEDE